MKVTAKEVLQGNWIIKRVLQGYKGKVRIDAQRRFHIDDEPDFFSEWVTLKYANRCRAEVGRRNLEIDL